jgi:hypothetical protein
MRRFTFIALILASNSAFAAKPFVPAEYPVAERRLFVTGCVNGNNAMHDFCVCVLTKFQDTMTFKEFGAMNSLSDEQLRKHKPYASAILTCAKQP